MADKSLTLDQFRTLRKDNWWVEPLLVVAVLGGFVIYSTWAAIQNAYYYAPPIFAVLFAVHLGDTANISPWPLVGSWWNYRRLF